MKKILCLLMTVFLLSAVACANENEIKESSVKGEVTDMKISIQITSDSGKSELTATLADNSSARAFYELLQKGTAYS